MFWENIKMIQREQAGNEVQCMKSKEAINAMRIEAIYKVNPVTKIKPVDQPKTGEQDSPEQEKKERINFDSVLLGLYSKQENADSQNLGMTVVNGYNSKAEEIFYMQRRGFDIRS